MQHRTLCFIGAGNMSRSIIAGLVKDGYPPAHIWACNPSRPKLDALNRDFGIQISQDNNEGLANADAVVLAVKPQLMAEVCAGFDRQLDLSAKLFISIAAGIAHGRLQQMLGFEARLVRTMPNTPSLLGLGMTGLYAPSQVNSSDKGFVGDMMSAVGEILWVSEEDKINGVIAAAGSSPAYFFRILQAMQEETEKLGFDTDSARKLVQQAMLGAASMVVHNPELTLEQLRQQVTSKGGTTAKAIEYFEQHDLPDTIGGAMGAAIARAEQMSEQF